jgi:anti-sigma factor RsiW
MTCRELAEFLWKYLEENLSESERARFDAHLGECPHCVAYLKTYRQTIAITREGFPCGDAAVPAEVPEDLLKAVLAAREK